VSYTKKATLNIAQKNFQKAKKHSLSIAFSKTTTHKHAHTRQSSTKTQTQKTMNKLTENMPPTSPPELETHTPQPIYNLIHNLKLKKGYRQ
jgi:hypothetical protein